MPSSATTRRVIIMGAAGRDFHNFNTALHDDPAREVIAFTAAQIPSIAGRGYPTALAGQRYPHGIPILQEDDLAAQIDWVKKIVAANNVQSVNSFGGGCGFYASRSEVNDD